jgi:hypothetical protein
LATTVDSLVGALTASRTTQTARHRIAAALDLSFEVEIIRPVSGVARGQASEEPGLVGLTAVTARTVANDAAAAQGSFSQIPACRAAGQIGCVIGYSIYSAPPPAVSRFGIPGQGASFQGKQFAGARIERLHSLFEQKRERPAFF